MKFPARAIAVVLWFMGVAVVAGQWFLYSKALGNFPGPDNTFYFVLLRVGASLAYFTFFLALGAIIWLLGEIRDRPSERR